MNEKITINTWTSLGYKLIADNNKLRIDNNLTASDESDDAALIDNSKEKKNDFKMIENEEPKWDKFKYSFNQKLKEAKIIDEIVEVEENCEKSILEEKNTNNNINDNNCEKNIWNQKYREYLISNDINNFDQLTKKQKKMVLFYKLVELKKNGKEWFLKGSCDSLNYEDLEFEYSSYLESQNKKSRIKHAKIVFLAIIMFIEFMNMKFDPFGFKLTGWSQSICNDDWYEDILDELYIKYFVT